ncbi:MAG TPA: alpha-amylase family protein [Clostridia bacterium]
MAKHWYQKNLRFLQTVLREIDIIGYDAKGVVDYMVKSNSNCLVVNAGGIVDFFDNPLELANINRFKTTENVLGDIVREVHAAGMHVIVRVDFRGVEKQRYDLHPDWFAALPDQSPRFNAQGLASPCYNSYYANEHAVEFIEYVMSHFDIDGIWENALGFDSSPCYCKRCRDQYLEDNDSQIPVIDDGHPLESAAFDEFRKWKAVRADMHIQRLRNATKKFGSEKAYCAEIFDMYNVGFSLHTGIDHYNAKCHFDFLVCCIFLNSRNPNRPYDLINNAASGVRFTRSLDPSKQSVIVTGGNGTRWRYTADPAEETRLWLWEIASVGGGVWNCYFNGQHPAATLDRRNAYSEKDAYTYLAQNSELIENMVPKEEIGIYYSKYTRDAYCKADEKEDQYGVFIKGIERVLLENHMQYNFISEMDFSMGRIKHLKALLIPNAALMSDHDVKVVREYVAAGGGLLASYKTSLFDETGEPREDFGLSDVFGVNFTGIGKDTSDDCYQLVADKSHPVLAGLGDTDVLINAGQTLLCKPIHDGTRQTVATYIPFIYNQPPEFGWRKEMKTEFPTITAGGFGKGRVVYFANQTDAQCFINGHEDFTEIYKNAIAYVLSSPLEVLSDAPRSVHLNVIEAPGDHRSMVAALVNTTGTSQRPMKEVVPARDFSVKVSRPGYRFKSCKSLWGEAKYQVQTEGAGVSIHFDVLDEFESVLLEWDNE